MTDRDAIFDKLRELSAVIFDRLSGPYHRTGSMPATKGADYRVQERENSCQIAVQNAAKHNYLVMKYPLFDKSSDARIHLFNMVHYLVKSEVVALPGSPFPMSRDEVDRAVINALVNFDVHKNVSLQPLIKGLQVYIHVSGHDQVMVEIPTAENASHIVLKRLSNAIEMAQTRGVLVGDFTQQWIDKIKVSDFKNYKSP